MIHQPFLPIPLPNHVTTRCPVQPIRGRETTCSISAVLLAFEKLLEILLQIRYIRIASLTGETSVNKGFYWAKGQKPFSKARHNHLGLKMRNIFSNRSQWGISKQAECNYAIEIKPWHCSFHLYFWKKNAPWDLLNDYKWSGPQFYISFRSMVGRGASSAFINPICFTLRLRRFLSFHFLLLCS